MSFKIRKKERRKEREEKKNKQQPNHFKTNT